MTNHPLLHEPNEDQTKLLEGASAIGMGTPVRRVDVRSWAVDGDPCAIETFQKEVVVMGFKIDDICNDEEDSSLPLPGLDELASVKLAEAVHSAYSPVVSAAQDAIAQFAHNAYAPVIAAMQETFAAQAEVLQFQSPITQLIRSGRFQPPNYLSEILKINLPTYPRLLDDEFASSLNPFAKLSIEALVPGLAETFSSVVDFKRFIPKWFTPEFIEGLRDYIRIGRPTNWGDEVDMDGAVTIAAIGWPIVWVPRSGIVSEIVAAPDDESRNAILVSYAPQILDDCEHALSSVSADEIGFLAGLALEAVMAGRHDLPGAAQATATAVADSVCKRHWGLNNGQVKDRANPDVDSLPIRRLLQAICLAAVAAAFQTFWPERGDSIPTEYNRHATIHFASEEQYSDANAIRAIMTATLAVCQIDHELRIRREALSA